MEYQYFSISLHKISCTRQFVNQFPLRSFALSLHKISNTKNNDYMIDYFAQNLWLAWLLISLLCLLLELTNGDFFIVCFAVGGLFASISSVFTDSLTIQIIVFAITTLLSIFFLRPVALRWFHKGEDRRISNVDALIGRIGRVTEAIEANGYGRVQIDGDSWKAKTRDGHPVENGMKARVLSIDSIIITVEEA